MSLRQLLLKPLHDAQTEQAFNELFRRWNEANETERKGLHASGVVELDSAYCLRKHVLSFFYVAHGEPVSFKLLRIFAAGWSIHEKWQALFERAGVASHIEAVRYSKEWDVYLTPDAIIDMNGKRSIVEIKSMNTALFKKLKSPPANAVRQCNFYMHQTGIPNGIVLVEDKNTQEFKVWNIRYDPHLVRQFIERMYHIHKSVERHGKALSRGREKLPPRVSENRSQQPCKWCRYADVCFNENVRRVSLKRIEDRQYRDN